MHFNNIETIFSKIYKYRIGPNPDINYLKYMAKYTDKYNVKKIVAEKNIHNLNTAKCLGTYNIFEDIDINVLPDKFVIKVNHWSGDIRIIHSRQDFINKYEILKNHFNSILKKIYRNGQEPHYKFISPVLFIEEYLDNAKCNYSFHNIYGQVCLIRRVDDNKKWYYYSSDWKKLNVYQNNQPQNNIKMEKPKYLDEMINISKILSKDMDYVRIDLYYDKGKIYLGEYTFTPSGCARYYFLPKEFNILMLKFYNDKNVDINLIHKYF
tara:strand:- start:423 stop:1220 length:798 start_codon:yes stop_codon:yes gene_type:complete